MTETFDCIVIGSGPGGYVAAIRASQLGLRTAIIERGPSVGGRCLHEACIPAKAMLHSADVLDAVQGCGNFGIIVNGMTVDFKAVARRRDEVVGSLAKGVSGLLRKNHIEVITGEATIQAEESVVVPGRTLRARQAIILATGSVPRALPAIPFGQRVIGTEGAWGLDELPRSIAVVGAGASGAEIASAYARLGTKVSLFEVADQVLPTEDTEISRLVLRSFVKQGITVHTATAIDSVKVSEREVVYTSNEGEGRADWLVLATGRCPDIETLGLDHLGVGLSAAGMVEVDERQMSSVPGMYAIGDMVPGPSLAHKASEEGVIAAEAAAGLEVHPLNHADIPRATFCKPNVGSFGLTEAEARDRNHDVVIARVPYAAIGASLTYGETEGLVKVVADASQGEILGGHVVGTRSTELLQQMLNVRSLEGGFQELARIVHSHPTFSELNSEVARAADGWGIHG